MPDVKEAFTPDSVFTLLRDKVLKGNGHLPGKTDPAIAHLALVLNMVEQEVQSTTEAWREEPQRLKRIDEAISVLTDILPKQLDYYAAIFCRTRLRPVLKEKLAAKQITRVIRDKRAKVFEELVTAARAARAARAGRRDLGLATLNVLFFPGPPKKSWVNIALDLQKVFLSVLRGKEASYRFIEAVVPAITGEKPTIEAVKTAFKKKRLINRGKRVG